MAQKWEYSFFANIKKGEKWTIYFGSDKLPPTKLSECLQRMGNDGWELVGVNSVVAQDTLFGLPLRPVETIQEVYTFKRPKP